MRALSAALLLALFVASARAEDAVPEVGPAGPLPEAAFRVRALALPALEGMFAASLAGAPAVEGELPELVTLERVATVWSFVRELSGLPAGTPAPTVRFESFDPALMSDAQKRFIEEWGKGHPEVPLPFPKNMQAYYFEGKATAQVSPAVFLRYYREDPSTGRRYDPAGFGYYSVGHELLHYAFETKGVPLARHHCLFITGDEDSLADRLAAKLSDAGLSSFIFLRRDGLNVERMTGACPSDSALPGRARSE
ncbi:MAG: hypothetical protein WC969_11805 [Elusimicrobiota bacterium]|jgi:hypothetical protein